MGMYCGVMLTPKAPGIVPKPEDVVLFVKHIVNTRDLAAPTTEEPLTVEIGLDPEGQMDAEDELEILDIDNELETVLAKNPSWAIDIDYYEPTSAKNDSPSPDSVFDVLKFEDVVDNSTNLVTLDSISISRVNVQSFAWGDWDDEWPDRDFSIVLCSNLKMREVSELEEKYPEVAWDRLVSAGIIDTIQSILKIELEPWPYIC